MEGAVRSPQVAQAQPRGLPQNRTSFVGRDAELRALRNLLSQSRLVTIHGTGGSGKTRLAAELVRGMTERWPDGTWWVDLVGAADVVGTVIAAAGLRGRGVPLNVATSWFESRRALLILDNCEHLITASAEFCHAAVDRCPDLTILATSREPLGVPGEVRWPLKPLTETDSSRLFEARAVLVRPDFKAESHSGTISRICERLDRLPLAIEMAAARLDVMSEKEVLANLNDRIPVLASGSRVAHERQQTMTAAINWSYRLLSEDEARMFRRLAVFQAGFTMEAAQEVCSRDAPAAGLGLVSALVQKSMVVAERVGDGTRYRLLESHREFAAEKLRDSGEQDVARRGHYEYYVGRRWEPPESANFWHAAIWARDHAPDGGLGLAMEIADSDFSGQARAKNLILELVERTSPGATVRARALAMATRLAWRQSDQAASTALAAKAVEAARETGDSELVARALNGAGLVHETSGDLSAAGRMYDEALSLLGASTNHRLVNDIKNTRAMLLIEQGRPAAAAEILTSCVAHARSESDGASWARYLESLANAQFDLGDIDEAEASWKRSMSTFIDVDDWFGIIWAMGGLALVAAARKQDDRALRLAAAAGRLSRQYSLGAWGFRVQQLEEACAKARTRLASRGRADAAWREGESMTTRDALEYAQRGAGEGQPAGEGAGPLSRREREVAGMVAAGMTNRQIAQKLFIAERTAEGHVERIRNKLGARSRAEVAAWAVDHGIKPTP